jgi:uncharacterized protein
VAAPRLALDHVALPVDDADAARRFYGDVLGLSLVDALSGDDWEGSPWLMMIFADAEGRQLALCAYRGYVRKKERAPSDARHYALAAAAPGELESWRQRLRGAGVEFREEDHGAQRSLYFADPSGNVLEITTPLPKRPTRRNPRAAEEVERWLVGEKG